MNKMNKQEIEKQAKEILDKFAKALDNVGSSDDLDFSVDRDEFERDEGELKAVDEDFKKRILDNAPNSNEDFVLVEKGSWK
jgi:Asp-tRNA(Asn)/Glu-tRNA(Gln) amidotransferase C subunit